jgi:transcription-repair coupling factor (superfamily II helicase)
MGTVRLASEGTLRDFLHIQYMGSEKLYVPTDQMDRVQKYIGNTETPPRLNKLGGNEWERQKAKVRKSVRELAFYLVALYARRQHTKGFPFGPDTPWQREFEDKFPYEETPDQLRCIEEIKLDMEKPICMDRLLCGDVGYGKTEVALRAAFKAVMSNKQVAILVPTTVLAQQHYQSILKRFEGFPVRVQMLSRFKSPAQQKKILLDLAAGEVDIIVGTHKLLGKDVRYKDLGLLIIDEEQRFGVAHKEKIKLLKESIDVLTLSATPIPRTLHMSMVGIRDLSTIETPPEDRYPVQTTVSYYSDSLTREAIERELGRGGQVYIVYNQVVSIERFAAHLRQIVPQARVVIAHGQMPEHQLEDVMLDFMNGQYDVLLCSTIIESGLDIAKANTMIVIDADRFGLAQLYQLRGRVGRSNRLAYCYLTIRENKVLSEIAQKRLTAIKEFTQFGSGFKIAMRDLELRGAGNIMGAQQSGHMASVGYDMYVKLIDEAVREVSGAGLDQRHETSVNLPVDAYLPEDFVRGSDVRMDIYKLIAQVGTSAQRDDCVEELIDRFGDLPAACENLVYIAYIKNQSQRIGLDQVFLRRNQIVLRFSPHVQLDTQRLVWALGQMNGRFSLAASAAPALLYPVSVSVDKTLRELAPNLERFCDMLLEQAPAGSQAGSD